MGIINDDQYNININYYEMTEADEEKNQKNEFCAYTELIHASDLQFSFIPDNGKKIIICNFDIEGNLLHSELKTYEHTIKSDFIELETFSYTKGKKERLISQIQILNLENKANIIQIEEINIDEDETPYRLPIKDYEG